MNSRYVATLMLSASLYMPYAPPAICGQVTKCVSPDGRVEFTDKPCPGDGSFTSTAIAAPPKQGGIDGKSTASDRLKSTNPDTALGAAEEIVSDPATLKDPLQLFAPALVLFQHGKKDEGVFWFYAAQLRTRHQLVFKKGDRQQRLTTMLITMGPQINAYAFQDASNFNQILDRVLAWDKKTFNPALENPRNEHSDRQISQVYDGFQELRERVSNNTTPNLKTRTENIVSLERGAAQKENLLQRKEQLNHILRSPEALNEWAQVSHFVKNNPSLIREAGNITAVHKESSITKQGSVMPSRYVVSVIGRKPTYAAIDVDRSQGSLRLALACITDSPPNQRNPFKDLCNQ